MNLEKLNILLLLKRLVLTTVLSAILLQLSAQTVAFVLNTNYEFELIGFNEQEESEKEEKQEDDSKDEKIEMQISGAYNSHFSFVIERSIYSPLKPFWDFTIEIPIPPPERL